MAEEDGGFLSRWSRRKTQTQSGVVPAQPLPPISVATPLPHPLREKDRELDPFVAKERQAAVTPELPPPPTMDDVALLTPASDYSRFVVPDVDAGVRNAAMKKLFSDPHYNVMDRLDIYIDDYSQPDPIPASMLRQMVQSKFLGLFDDEEEAEKQKLAEAPTSIASNPAALSTPDNPVLDEDSDLQLQPDDAAGRPGADEGAGPRES